MSQASDAISILSDAVKELVTVVSKLIDAEASDRTLLSEANQKITDLQTQTQKYVEDDSSAAASITDLVTIAKELAAKALAATAPIDSTNPTEPPVNPSPTLSEE